MNEISDTVQTQQPVLSLIIATVGRTAELERCLAAMSGERLPVEVIVVDQNDDDRVARVLRRALNPHSVTHLRISRKCASLARNLGAGAARGLWLGFPDDDCWYRPDTLAKVLARIDQAKVDLISGRLLGPDGEPAMLRWLSKECAITPNRLRRAVTESTLFLRREVFLSVEGFDGLFGPGSMFAAEEGVDLLRRLHRDRRDVRTLFCPEIEIHHRNPSGYADEEALAKTAAYCHARGACRARHWRSASPWRITVALGRKVLGCVVSRGRLRRCRLRSLQAYRAGFFDYLRLQRTVAHRRYQTSATSTEQATS